VHYSLALCTGTSFFGCREHVDFVLSSTCRQNRAETQIDAFHIKTIIFGRASRI
jgi:hypothetical protein